jgi:hypothetical protein
MKQGNKIMTAIEQIVNQLEQMPTQAHIEALHFVQFLAQQSDYLPHVASNTQIMTTNAFVERFAGAIPDFPEVEPLKTLQERETLM